MSENKKPEKTEVEQLRDEVNLWQERYLVEAQKYARLLLAMTNREIGLFRARVQAERAEAPQPEGEKTQG